MLSNCKQIFGNKHWAKVVERAVLIDKFGIRSRQKLGLQLDLHMPVSG